MAKNPLIRFFDFLANMGLMVRDDPPKVIDVAARTWGTEAAGFALSIEPLLREEEGTPLSLSVVLRNVSGGPMTFTVPGWLHFLRIEIDADLSPFGRQLLKPERATERIPVTLKAGEPIEAQVPVGTLYSMARGVSYRISASCTPPSGETVVSNVISISA